MSDGTAKTRAELRRMIEENFLYLYPGVEVGDGDDLLALGVLDSLGFVELVEHVQTSYGITVADIEITEENFGSIAAIADYVQSKRAEVGGAHA